MIKDYPIRHSSWPRNAKGGYKVITLPLRRKRHDGVRCYGYHQGSKCWPYDFAAHPSLPQAHPISRALYTALHGLSGHEGANATKWLVSPTTLCNVCEIGRSLGLLAFAIRQVRHHEMQEPEKRAA